MSAVKLVRAEGEEVPVPRGPLRVMVHGATDPGLAREENQDAFAIVDPRDPAERERKGILLVIADGMGGLAGGGIASRIVTEALGDAYPHSELDPAEALKAAVTKANLLIFGQSQGRSDHEPMGSTVTALAIVGDRAFLAHVGDSRAYRLPPAGPIRRLTRDHTWVEELAQRGELDSGSLQYALYRNVLTRALGLHEEVEVDLEEIADLLPGDTFLLCSDGLHDVVEEVEMEARLRARGADLRAAVSDLIGLARDRGGPDNITAAISRVEAARPHELFAFRPGATGAAEAAHAFVPGRLFPRFMPFSLLAAFALGVGAVLLLEKDPLKHAPIPAMDPIDQILEDPAYRNLFDSTDGARIREALSAYRHAARRKEG